NLMSCHLQSSSYSASNSGRLRGGSVLRSPWGVTTTLYFDRLNRSLDICLNSADPGRLPHSLIRPAAIFSLSSNWAATISGPISVGHSPLSNSHGSLQLNHAST